MSETQIPRSDALSRIVVNSDDLVLDLEDAPKSVPLQQLPADKIQWFEECRRQAYGRMLDGGGQALRCASYHLPMVTTCSGGEPFPFNCCNKGVGFLPKEEFLDEYIAFFKQVHGATRGRPWKDSLRERVEAARKFYLDRDAIDYRACATLEIFEKTTFSALQRRPFASLLFTGEAPVFTSFQLNTAVEIVGQDDPRHTFVMLLRTLFESEPFHIYQPQFPYAYVFWISEVKDKTPFRVDTQPAKVQYETNSGSLPWEKDATEAIQGAPSLIQEHIRDTVETYARQRGFTVVTNQVVQEARDQSMPAQQGAGEIEPTPERTVAYKSICVPVDNSDHSKRAENLAIELGVAFGAKLTGCHVYAAKMHEYRFKQMEYSLPEKYLEEQELEHQRRVHDSMIAMGLKLISESYVDPIKRRCAEAGLEFESKMMDGKHHIEIVQDARISKYDLVIMGALGLGRGRDSLIGSVCERVTREIDGDLWVVKDLNSEGTRPGDRILVGIDGSPQSFGALCAAVELAKHLDRTIECVAVFDPYLHYSVFNGLAGVLSEEASKVFNFEEQNKLHEDIIDNGLAQIYQSHLNVAETMAREKGVSIVKTLLAGKAFQEILDHARKTKPWLLVLGRIGVHSLAHEAGLGSNTENLLRSSPCDILLTTGLAYPKLDVKAEETIRWTQEAEDRMANVPDTVKNVARTAIVRLAVEKGHSVITSALVGEAMDRYMPKHAGKSALRLAQAFAYDHVKEKPVSVCKACGTAATESEPVKCAICGATDFERVTSEMIEETAQIEGGIEVEATYDGRQLKWSLEARRAIGGIEDEEQRRRAKGRIEKSARGSGVGVITLAFCQDAIEHETGKPFSLADSNAAEASGPTEVREENGANGTPTVQGQPSAAVDANGDLLQSKYSWTEEAAARVLRVPAGFMRSKTQDYVENLAAVRGVDEIDLPLVEAGLEMGRKGMSEMMSNFGAGSKDTQNEAAEEDRPPHKPAEGQEQTAAPHGGAKMTEMMNEIGLMSAMEKLRDVKR